MQAAAEPRPQLRTAILFGETPTAAAERSFSETASVSIPKFDDRYSNQNKNAEKLPIASKMRRSTVILTSPYKVTRSTGS